MIEAKSFALLSNEVRACVDQDKHILDELRADVRPLKRQVRRIHPHTTTAISLVGTDGGNNHVQFDPFMVEVVRVVDSSNNEYCLEAVTPRTDIEELSKRHLDPAGKGRTPLGRLMEVVGVRSVYDLASIRRPRVDANGLVSAPQPSWVQTYREMVEWAVLLDLVRTRDFGTDTLIVRDGFLRSKMFRDYHFSRGFKDALTEAIDGHYSRQRRRIYVVGIAKHSSVLQTYGLAMALEGVLRTNYPAYVEVPRSLELKVYKWSEYARGDESAIEGGEGNRFVAGRMFLVKFGRSPYDPVWAVDVLDTQVGDAAKVLGHLLHDALEGFPIPYYPHCLQRAHEHAALVDFDMQVLQDQILGAFRDLLGEKRNLVDEFHLQNADPAAARYE